MTSAALETYGPAGWADHLSSLRWDKGEHVLIAAPTGAGKTTLASTLIEKRSHVVVFVTKMKDDTFRKEFPQRKGWTRLYEWPKNGPKSWQTRILLWPKVQKTIAETLMNMRRVFARALEWIARKGGYCVVIDESLMFNDPKILGFGTQVGMLHYYGRSHGISMVDLTQRPSWIPKVIYSSVTHAYVARTRDSADLKRLADLGGVDPKVVSHNVASLGNRHDYLYLNPQGDANPVVVNTRK